MPKYFFDIFQILLSIILCLLILLQARAGGLGSAFGGASFVYRSKRGVEKMIYYATILAAVLFFLNALLNFVLFV